MHKAQEMVDLAEDGFMKGRLSSLNQAHELAIEIHTKDDVLVAALANIASGTREAKYLLSVPSHIESIASSIIRIIEGIRTRIKEGLLFSDRAMLELQRLFTTAKHALKKAGEAAVTGAKTTIQDVLGESDALGRMTNEFATAHEERLVTGECPPKSSSTYLSMLYAFEEMSAHIKHAAIKLSCK